MTPVLRAGMLTAVRQLAGRSQRGRTAMPFIQVSEIKGVFSPEQKAETANSVQAPIDETKLNAFVGKWKRPAQIEP
jgi:hypothetical protein